MTYHDVVGTRDSTRGYFPFDTDTQVADWPLVCEDLPWVSPGRQGLPPLTVMTHRRRSGKCTVLIPGLNGTWPTWLPLLQAMRSLGVDPGAIFVLDFSDTRFPSTVPDLRDVCEDVLSFVSAGGYERVDLVGHSTGGCLATFMCTLASEDVRVDNLYSVGGMFVSLFDAAHLSLRASLTSTKAARNLAKLRVIARGGPAANLGLRAVANSDALSRYLLAGLYAHPEDVPPAALQRNVGSFSVQTLRDTLDIGGAYDYRAIYPRVGAPVRFVLGDCDPLVTEQDAVVADTLVPRLSFYVLKDTGHFAHLERPMETATQLYLE